MPNFKNKIILILLITSAIINDMTLRALTVGNIFYWKPIITSIAMILIISAFALFMSNKIRNYIYGFLSLYFAIFTGINYMYYKHYNSFISFSLINQLKQIKEIGDSVTNTVDPRILLFVIPTIVLIFIMRILNKGQLDTKLKNSLKAKQFVVQLLLGVILLTGVSFTLTSTDKSRITKQWNRPYLVEQLGLYSYSVADFVKTVAFNNISDYKEEEAVVKLEEFVDEKFDVDSSNKYTDIFEGKDVFVIHYESAEKFAMDLKFEDNEVTPFLNKMSSEGLFFNNFYPQHSAGTSSDSEFTFNTSLLPINNGTVFLTHFDREYVTLPKLLKDKGYYTFSMHGNNGDFWNRNVMHESLGYDRFFSQDDYNIDEEIGLGLSDKSFFRQSIEKIKQIKEEKKTPVMATLITLTNHYPFDEVDKYGEFNVGHLEGTDIGNYLKSLHYADGALESFIEGMDEAGLLDNAVVVLYGDHHAKISKSDYEKVYNYDPNTGTYYNKDDENYYSVSGANNKQLKRTPFIIWTKDKKINETINTPMGMVDALPTISNMLGVYNPYQLGQDMVSAKENTVIFPNGDWLDSDSYYSSSSSKVYNLDDNEVNKEDDFTIVNNVAEETIELSNSIIQHDLIKYFNGYLAHNKNLSPEQKSDIGKKPNL